MNNDRAAANEHIADAIRDIAYGRAEDDQIWNWDLVEICDDAAKIEALGRKNDVM